MSQTPKSPSVTGSPDVTDSPQNPDGRSTGETTRRAVLGDAHVNRAMAGTTEFDAPFQDLITDAAWDKLWSRPAWSHRERSMVTIALLAALGHDEEVAMHIRATANTGASRADICEALMHVAIYAGVPAANSAFKIARETFVQMDETSLASTGGDETAETAR